LHLRAPFPFVLLRFHAFASLLAFFPLFYHLPPSCKKMKRTLTTLLLRQGFLMYPFYRESA